MAEIKTAQRGAERLTIGAMLSRIDWVELSVGICAYIGMLLLVRHLFL